MLTAVHYIQCPLYTCCSCKELTAYSWEVPIHANVSPGAIHATNDVIRPFMTFQWRLVLIPGLVQRGPTCTGHAMWPLVDVDMNVISILPFVRTAYFSCHVYKRDRAQHLNQIAHNMFHTQHYERVWLLHVGIFVKQVQYVALKGRVEGGTSSVLDRRTAYVFAAWHWAVTLSHVGWNSVKDQWWLMWSSDEDHCSLCESGGWPRIPRRLSALRKPESRFVPISIWLHPRG